MVPTPEESARRSEIIQYLLRLIERNQTVKLPDFDGERAGPTSEFPFATVGLEANPLGGTIGEFRYQFEGEEDLLHLVVMRSDQQPLSPAEGVSVGDFVLNGVPKGLIRLRPGDVSQHFFLGHENLMDHVIS